MRGSWRGRGRGRGRGDGRRDENSTRRNRELAEVSKETREVLPDILPHIPSVNATLSEQLDINTLPPLDPAKCPGHPPAVIRIVNEDTFNAAIDLGTAHPDGGRVAILNLASDVRAGGGWLKGALAQEEALCYRSSLYLSLHRSYYPFASETTALYTPDVVIIRGDMDSGHDLLVPEVAPQDLPIVSAVSVAALRNPDTARVRVATQLAQGVARTVERDEFAKPRDREVTKAKMRVALRVAAARGHGLLVLGALGCGAFRNPKGEVARCWREVLSDAEFSGGWWKGVVFAVLDRRNEGNFATFDEVLGGMQV